MPVVSDNLPAARTPRPGGRWLQTAIEVLLIFAVFALHGSWQVPDVNESHYLTKAKHYWQPEWCPNDFFLNTDDAHHVFYWTVGWLTLWLPLPTVAWIGRIVTWLLLAWSFQRLARVVVPRPWYSVLAAALFICLAESAHMAGEWIVGGVEAKGFAYVLVFVALERLVAGRWQIVPPLLGLAAMFHVLVGGWAMLAAGIVWLVSPRERVPLTKMLFSVMLGIALSLPAVLPALGLSRGVDAETLREATRIYVNERLSHHLQLDKFKEGFAGRHVLSATIFLLLCTVTPATAGERRLRWFVGSAAGLAAIGFGVVLLARFWPEVANSLLRYYWFRLTDILMPIGITLTGLSFVAWLWQTRPPLARAWTAVLVVAALADSIGQATLLVNAPGARGDKNVAVADWQAACAWVVDNTPDDAVFITPRLSATFKWYTGRGEVVTWKDIPQNAEKIVEWQRRMQDMFARPNARPGRMWRDSLAEHGESGLAERGKKYGAQYAVVELVPEAPRLATPPLFENASYAVYRLADFGAP